MIFLDFCDSPARTRDFRVFIVLINFVNLQRIVDWG